MMKSSSFDYEDPELIYIEKQLESGTEVISGGIIGAVLAIVGLIITFCAAFGGSGGGSGGGGSSKNSSATDKMDALINSAVAKELQKIVNGERDNPSVLEVPSERHFNKMLGDTEKAYFSADSLQPVLNLEKDLLSYYSTVNAAYIDFINRFDFDKIYRALAYPDEKTDLKYNEENPMPRILQNVGDKIYLPKNTPENIKKLMRDNTGILFPINITKNLGIKIETYAQIFGDESKARDYINRLLDPSTASLIDDNKRHWTREAAIFNNIEMKMKKIKTYLKNNDVSDDNIGKKIWKQYGIVCSNWYRKCKSIHACRKLNAKYIPSENDLKYELKRLKSQ